MANSVLESNTDRQMVRLKRRCRALEVVGSVKATVIALALISSAVIIAATFVNMLSTTLLIAAAATYLLLYTSWLKKSSCWGVAAGAIPGALPPLIGSAAVTGHVSAPSLMLAFLIFVWQLPHFWFLALQHLDDYRQATIPVLPVTHGINLTKALSLLCVVLLIPISLTFYITGYNSVEYAVVACIVGSAFLVICIIEMLRSQVQAQAYHASVAYLAVILAALICDCYVG
jgi:protoheme IX farnesyltransferase